MNFLAHSLFSKSDELTLVGQYCGDFVRGSNLQAYPQKVQDGIRLHRHIDSYTDSHPTNLRARNLFRKPYRRFAGIITDVLYDHFLALSWDQYSPHTLHSHTDFVYRALQNHVDLMPPDLQRFASVVVSNNVLMSYLEFDTVASVLQKISQRSSRFEVLSDCGAVLASNRTELQECFDEFFPDLVTQVAKHNQAN